MFISSGWEWNTTHAWSKRANLWQRVREPLVDRAFIETGSGRTATVFCSSSAPPPATGRSIRADASRPQLVGLEAEVKDARFLTGGVLQLQPEGDDRQHRRAAGRSVPAASNATRRTRRSNGRSVQFYPTLRTVARKMGTVKPVSERAPMWLIRITRARLSAVGVGLHRSLTERRRGETRKATSRAISG